MIWLKTAEIFQNYSLNTMKYVFFNFDLRGNVLLTKIVIFLLNLHLNYIWVYAHFGRFKQNVGPSGVKGNQGLTNQMGGC